MPGHGKLPRHPRPECVRPLGAQLPLLKPTQSHQQQLPQMKEERWQLAGSANGRSPRRQRTKRQRLLGFGESPERCCLLLVSRPDRMNKNSPTPLSVSAAALVRRSGLKFLQLERPGPAVGHPGTYSALCSHPTKPLARIQSARRARAHSKAGEGVGGRKTAPGLPVAGGGRRCPRRTAWTETNGGPSGVRPNNVL